MNEPTYTLDEARADLARRECAREGHDYSVTAARTMGTAGRPIAVKCDTCGEHWGIAPPHILVEAYEVDGRKVIEAQWYENSTGDFQPPPEGDRFALNDTARGLCQPPTPPEPF